MLLGAHMSIEGGLDLAVERARRAGCDVLQVFTKSSNQWKAKGLSAEDVSRFRMRLETDRIGTVSAHDSYLINMASPDDALHRKSVDALIEELRRCETLGIPYLIAHPGAHVGSGVEAGIRRIAAALNEALAAVPGPQTMVLLETWAGQGTTIGARFEELARILGQLNSPERIGVCFDTCHVFAAGYDIRTAAGYEAALSEFDALLGLARIRAFHLNDSKNDLGCRVDRHEHIGKGWIGLEAFRILMNDARFASVPMYLETPKGPDLLEDIENLATLRSLIGDSVPRPWVQPAPRETRLPRAGKNAGAMAGPGENGQGEATPRAGAEPGRGSARPSAEGGARPARRPRR